MHKPKPTGHRARKPKRGKVLAPGASEMTRQELLEKVVRHCDQQGERSLRLKGGTLEVCAYRGKEGLKCAIGALMPDSSYSESLEGISPHNFPDRLLSSCGFDVRRYREKDFATQLQVLHDSPDSWRRGRLKKEAVMGLARDWGLRAPRQR